jgi:hypothetical protein
MFDKSEFRGKPFGREHLSGAIEKKFGIKTRESFQLQDDDERLAAYCRADVELCDELTKLDRANGGKGLCSSALAFAGIFIQDPNYSAQLGACRALPRSEIACVHFGYQFTRSADAAIQEERCRERIKERLLTKP